MTGQSFSPVPKANYEQTDQVEQMDFPKAIQKIIEGEKVTKREWQDSQIYGVLQDGFLALHKTDGKFHSWLVSDGDMFGEDWVVVA